MPYRVRLTRRAESALLRLPPDRRRRILGRLIRLETNPFPHGKAIKRLRARTPDGDPLYRLRSGDYRVIYFVRRDEVIVLAVVHRKELEPVLRRLSPGA